MPSRVRRPAEQEDVLRAIIDGQPFATMAAALLFAAAVGHAHNRRIPFERSNELLWEPFANLGAEALLEMLAASASDDPQILAADRDEERVRIFEEYANGGLDVIRERLASHGGTPLDALLLLVLEFEEQPSATDEVDLAKLAERLSPP